MYIQPITMGVDWPEIGRLIEVSAMFFADTAFLLSTVDMPFLDVNVKVIGLIAVIIYGIISIKSSKTSSFDRSRYYHW